MSAERRRISWGDDRVGLEKQYSTKIVYAFAICLFLFPLAPVWSATPTAKAASEKVARQMEALQNMSLSGDVVGFRRGVPAYFSSAGEPVSLTMTSFPRLMLEGRGVIDELLIRVPRSIRKYAFDFSLGCG